MTVKQHQLLSDTLIVLGIVCQGIVMLSPELQKAFPGSPAIGFIIMAAGKVYALISTQATPPAIRQLPTPKGP